MARISKYINDYTEKSEEIAKEFSGSAISLSLEDLEALQTKFGISNVLLGETLKISLGVLSKWKTGERDLPDYYKINIYCFFKYLADKMEK